MEVLWRFFRGSLEAGLSRHAETGPTPEKLAKAGEAGGKGCWRRRAEGRQAGPLQRKSDRGSDAAAQRLPSEPEPCT